MSKLIGISVQNLKGQKTLMRVLLQKYNSTNARSLFTIRANSVCENCDTPQACRANGYCALKN